MMGGFAQSQFRHALHLAFAHFDRVNMDNRSGYTDLPRTFSNLIHFLQSLLFVFTKLFKRFPPSAPLIRHSPSKQ
jgi:hypothetical protein